MKQLCLLRLLIFNVLICLFLLQLIFSAEYTNAMEKDWHAQHFSCWQCDDSLTGQRYVLRDEHPYCVNCYENVFANKCEKCDKKIGIDSKVISKLILVKFKNPMFYLGLEIFYTFLIEK